MTEPHHAVTALFGPLTDEERQTIRDLPEFDRNYGFVGTTPDDNEAIQEAVMFVLDENEEDAMSWLEALLRGWHLPFIAFQAAPAPG